MSLLKSAITICVSLLCCIAAGQDLPEQYREPFAKSWPIREKQHLQMKAYLDSFPARKKETASATFQLNYQNAAAYAKDRLQGRSLTGPKNPDGPADPIIVHADVRRMLLGVRASTEALRALALWTSMQIDVWLRHPDEDTRQTADDLRSITGPRKQCSCRRFSIV